MTYAIKVTETAKANHPYFPNKVFTYYFGKSGWMSIQPMYEGYATLRGAKVAMAVMKKQMEYRHSFNHYINGYFDEEIVGIVEMNGREEVMK